MLLSQKKYGPADMAILSFKTSPLYSFVFALKYVADALLPTLSIFITANFVNAALLIAGGSAPLSSAYAPVAFLVIIMLYETLNGVAISLVDCKRRIFYRKKLSAEMTEWVAGLDYRHIENPKTADLILRVCPSYTDGSAVWSMYARVCDLANLAIYVGGIIAAMFFQVWWIALTMLAASVPLLFVANKAGKRSYDADKEMSKIDRRARYLSDVMRSREAVEEREMFGTTERLNAQYEEKYEYARKFRLKVSAANFIKQKAGGFVTTAYSAGAMLALLPPVLRGDMTIGMFIALLIAVFGLAGRLSWGVNWQMEDLSRKREYLKDLTLFAALERNPEAASPPGKNVSFEKIEFREVCFAYPDTEKKVLDGLSFTIERGRHYSFVGVNGAGKTTIAKLFTGLYSNYEGEILVDGKNLREFSQPELKGLSSVIYQDYAKYSISLYDNIAIADMNNYGDRKSTDEAIGLAGLGDAVSKLKDGADTPLGKVLEGGADLSGGEWQRVAMARSVMNPAPLKILDEPTAALDPIGESAVYRNFERITRGRTTVFISHRLGSTRLADVIFVLEDGKIVERGPHQELLKRNGTYREMWDSQAEWYKEADAAGDHDG